MPRSERPLAEYFDLALAQSPPFDAEGRGFKDALILCSVIDDLRRRNVRGLLVTRDKDFQGTETLAQRLGAQLIIRNVDEAASILHRRLSAAARDAYAAAEREALALARQELARLSQFITENLEVPSRVLADPAEQLLRFLGVQVTGVKGVQADPLFSAMRTGDRVKVTYTFGVQLLADVMPIPATLIPPTTVKVGGSVTPSAEGFENLAPVAVRLKERDLIAEIREIVKLTDTAAGQDAPAAGQ